MSLCITSLNGVPKSAAKIACEVYIEPLVAFLKTVVPSNPTVADITAALNSQQVAAKMTEFQTTLTSRIAALSTSDKAALATALSSLNPSVLLNLIKSSPLTNSVTNFSLKPGGYTNEDKIIMATVIPFVIICAILFFIYLRQYRHKRR